MREKASVFDWNTLRDDDIDVYASNIESKIISLSRECIPNKNIKVRPFEPPWLTTFLKRKIRKRKRSYKKSKIWSKFRELRNEVNDLVRSSKNNISIEWQKNYSLNHFHQKIGGQL